MKVLISLSPRHNVTLHRQTIDNLTFALVAPLRADDHIDLKRVLVRRIESARTLCLLTVGDGAVPLEAAMHSQLR